MGVRVDIYIHFGKANFGPCWYRSYRYILAAAVAHVVLLVLEREFWPSNHGYSMFIGSFWLYPLCGKESRETCILSSKDPG